ncbi:MAG: hypothetical protein ABIN01_19490 [Ferruginibacter sp.]
MSNINRNNYETFFLLYADNELSVPEKIAVDQFVQLNPDLQEELVMLQQSVLKPDDIIYVDKKSLLKDELIPAALHEQLLLHLDNELSAPDTKEMDKLIKANADINKEWDILQQTKLLPGETIVFADKKSLYRSERGRVISFPWKRIAVAAIAIGIGIWGAVIYFNNNASVSPNETAKNTKPARVSNRGAIELPTKPTTAAVEKPIAAQEDVVVTKEKVARPSTSIAIPSIKKPAARATGTRDTETFVVKENDNNLPEPYQDVNKIGSNKTITAYVPEKQANVNNPGDNDFAKNISKQDPGMVVSTASYADNAEENNDRVLYMNEETIKKTKLGGIFRKVKRVLERNANIKPGGNHIKVANLEFAIQ